MFVEKVAELRNATVLGEYVSTSTVQNIDAALGDYKTIMRAVRRLAVVFPIVGSEADQVEGLMCRANTGCM